ncbi:lytic transglycosylase domain-containing protein [Pseudonocardia spinosispora]|uniref:lytic transglycosylase domain-containing protein n=1 Tax=Pseudonocardia spinosispora TaxID=103441 RepID=UPI0003F76DC5|nr:lytic transglycosylase domain-containing protein [Pseudonocardia spinosispora]
MVSRLSAVVLALLLLTSAGCSAGGGNAPGPACASTPDPATLACRIGAAEGVIHDPEVTREALASAGRDAQDAYQELGSHPEWDAQVLAALDPARREPARYAADAYRQLTSLAGAPGANLPAWRIVDPLPSDTLRGLYGEAQQRFGVDWTVLAAVNLVETRMGRVVGLSSAGAQGPMQFMPPTWAQYGLGGDVWQPRDAILGAANYLAANGGADPARLDRALKRYNNDVRYVRAVRDYAAMMAADPRAFVGLHAWPVEYRSVAGDIPLNTGYASARPIPVAEWLATNPPPAVR